MKPNLRSVEVTQVIHIMTLEGRGLPNDLAREVHRYYAPDGEFLAENDPCPPKEKETINKGGIDIQEIRKDERDLCLKVISDLSDEAMRAHKDYEDLNKAYCRIQTAGGSTGVTSPELTPSPQDETSLKWESTKAERIRQDERMKCIDELEKERNKLTKVSPFMSGISMAINYLQKHETEEHPDGKGKPTEE